MDLVFGINVRDPLGLGVGKMTDFAQAAQEQGGDLIIYSNILKAFVSKEGAFAYLLFIFLYAPHCYSNECDRWGLAGRVLLPYGQRELLMLFPFVITN